MRRARNVMVIALHDNGPVSYRCLSRLVDTGVDLREPAPVDLTSPLAGREAA